MKLTILPAIIACVLCINAMAQVNFQPHLIIDEGSTNGPRAVFAADLDGDGHLDLVSASEYDSKIAWYKNDGAGNLGAQQIISLDVKSPIEAHAVDFDDDGNVDILVSSSENSKVVWFKNNGSGSFSVPLLITDNLDGISHSIPADIDGDGDLDVVVSSYGEEKIFWFENIDGQGTFGTQLMVSINIERTGEIAAFDLDNDGDLDIIASTIYQQKTVWYENLDGQGNFGSENLIDTNASAAYAFYGFDIDDDGDTDIITTKSNSLIYYENLNGQGNFSTARTLLPDEISYFLFQDIDQDGDKDILSIVGKQEIAWYENLNGQGNFGNKQSIVSVKRISFLNMADVDENGSLDILTAKFAKDEISWYPSSVPGTFGNENVISVVDGAQGAYSVQEADIDGDGAIDVVSGNIDAETITWYRNIDGQGTFGPQIIVGSNIQYVQSIYIADLDGDGDMDIVSSSDEDNLATWYKNVDGQGNFIKQQPFSVEFESPMFVTSDDLDGDGDMDIIVWDFNFRMAWFPNIDGLGNFGSARTIDGQADYSESIHAVDLDNDGDKDIITAINGDRLFAWYENLDGQGNFSTQNIIEDNLNGVIEIYFSDLDADGDMDILGSIIRDDLLVWYENMDGLGTFGPRKIISDTAQTPEEIRTFDADLDGDLDVFVADYTEDNIYWYENIDGLGNFGSQQIIDTNMNGTLSLGVADFNNDGKIDLLAGAWLGDKLKWYENLGSLGLQDNNLDITILFPIPSNDILNIKSNSKIVEAVVYNELGQLLLKSQSLEGISTINIEILSSGIYFIKLTDLEQNTITKKFIKQN
ncbi:T9SS type A sorting domain-containing protein [Aequorivita capsosiphonis]|uniref:T9SS type A sorting domain-containing protein n=1 Tax=Aequorivita capsosiphonis TaxID=487317 RepID=UPI000411B31D|nr:T9SS type A sorting domain-containing protein [Aequorivita capsosiphonis]